MLYLVCPMVVGTWLLGPEIMTIVSGPTFASSGEVLRILIIAVGIIYVNTITSHAIVALNTQRKMLPIYIVVALFTLAGYLLFIPKYGMWAAAWLTVASEIGVCIGSWTMVQRTSPFHLDPRTVLATISASLLMGGVVWFFHLASLALSIGLGVIVYTIALLALGGVTITRLKQLLKPSEG